MVSQVIFFSSFEVQENESIRVIIPTTEIERHEKNCQISYIPETLGTVGLLLFQGTSKGSNSHNEN